MGLNMQLTPEEIRILGCLLEKAVTTPDQYPLTLNALTLACNQKSSREPVMSLEPGAVAHLARGLEEKHLLSISEGRTGVSKYAQRLCNTLLSNYKLSPPEYALVCLLLLRGPQTPGELRARSARVHGFADNEEVKTILQALMEREAGPLVARLPRRAGRKDHEYMHLFAGEVESVAEEPGAASHTTATPRADRFADLQARVERLENALRDLGARLGEAVDLGERGDDPEPGA